MPPRPLQPWGFLHLPTEMQCAVIARAVARQIDDTLAGPPTKGLDTITSLMKIRETRQITQCMLSLLMQYGDGSSERLLRLLGAIYDLKRIKGLVYEFAVNEARLDVYLSIAALHPACSGALQMCESTLRIKQEQASEGDGSTTDVSEVACEERPAAGTARFAYTFLTAAMFFLSGNYLFQRHTHGEVQARGVLQTRMQYVERVRTLCDPIIATLKRNELADYLLPRLYAVSSAADTIISSEIVQKSIEVEDLFASITLAAMRHRYMRTTPSLAVITEWERMSGRVRELAQYFTNYDLNADARPPLTKQALQKSVNIASAYIVDSLKELGKYCS